MKQKVLALLCAVLLFSCVGCEKPVSPAAVGTTMAKSATTTTVATEKETTKDTTTTTAATTVTTTKQSGTTTTRTTTKATTTTVQTTVNTTFPSASVTDKAFADAVLVLVNAERAKEGLAALTYRGDLQALADIRVQEITQLFEHTRPDGRQWHTVIPEDIKYRAAGENLAEGQQTPERVVEAWMNSPPHRANILEADYYNGMAVGHIVVDGYHYWAQMFIGTW